jgi:hypothetical protein
MNEDIIRMAREAGWDAHHAEFDTRIQAFATLVDAAAKAEENEACARLCDQMFHDWCNQEFEDEDEAYRNKPDAEDCKKAIRARGDI